MRLSYFGFGINRFRYFPESRLHGPVNDIVQTAALYAQAGWDTAGLLDQDATEDAVKAGLLAWRGDTWPEHARLAIHVSSHGSREADPDHRPDGYHEVTVLHDYDGRGNGSIRDGWWHAFLQGIPATTRVYLFVDTCHSADVTRTLGGRRPRPRYLPNPWCAGPRPRRAPHGLRGLVAGMVDADPSFPAILYAACDADGTAADTEQDGQPCGAFTWAVRQWLPRALAGAPDLSNRVAISATAVPLAAAGYAQRAHLQCAPAYVDEPVFAFTP